MKTFPVAGLMLMVSFGCQADIDGCKEMARKDSDAMLPIIKKSFIDSNIFPIDRVSVSEGRDCGNTVYYFFEAKPPYQNPGLFWIVELNKKTGKIHITPGI